MTQGKNFRHSLPLDLFRFQGGKGFFGEVVCKVQRAFSVQTCMNILGFLLQDFFRILFHKAHWNVFFLLYAYFLYNYKNCSSWMTMSSLMWMLHQIKYDSHLLQMRKKRSRYIIISTMYNLHHVCVSTSYIYLVQWDQWQIFWIKTVLTELCARHYQITNPYQKIPKR